MKSIYHFLEPWTSGQLVEVYIEERLADSEATNIKRDILWAPLTSDFATNIVSILHMFWHGVYALVQWTSIHYSFLPKHNKQLAEKRFYLLKIRLTKHLIIIEAFKIVRVESVWYAIFLKHFWLKCFLNLEMFFKISFYFFIKYYKWFFKKNYNTLRV